MTSDKRTIIGFIHQAFEDYASAPSQTAQASVPATVTDGKMYEAFSLAVIAERLTVDEGLSLQIVGGTKIQLKSSPGPINRKYTYFEVRKDGHLIAELWTDIEVLGLSFATSGQLKPSPGHYHELDIVMVDCDLTGRPTREQLWLGIECKNTTFTKAHLRQSLGIRRELSFLSHLQNTKFTEWPRPTVPADPPSCLLVMSSDPTITSYVQQGTTFGIDFVHVGLP